jgi:hypothetical protein
VDVTFKVGQRFFRALVLGLPLEQENGQRPEQGKVARRSGLTHWAAIFVLGAVPAVVLSVFDAPMFAGHFQQPLRASLLRPIHGHGKTGVIGFFDHLALAHDLSVTMNAHDLSHTGQPHRLGVGSGAPQLADFNASVVLVHRRGLRSKVTGDVQKSIVSTCFVGSPEVEVGFTVVNSDYFLAKRFSGNTGTTRLVQVGGETWHGEDAESRLASLLKVEAVGSGKGVAEKIKQQWSHLWVWQGQSGNDPSEHANIQKDGLLQRLQQTGGAAALQSEMDAQVAARFAAAKEGIFTQAAKPKTGSELEKAENEVNQAEMNRQRASERVEKLREAARDFEEATQTISRAADDLQNLNQQKAAVNEKLSRVDGLRRHEIIQLPNATTAADKHQALKQSDTHISELRAKIQTLQVALRPKNEETKILEGRSGNAKQYAGNATQDYDNSANRTRDSRLGRDLAAACVARFEKDARLQELLLKDGQVRGHQEQLACLREKLAKLPEVTASKLKKLQKLEAELNQSEAALNAMAAGIAVLSASGPVRVGDALLAVGQSQIVTEETEIAVGESLHLRISPGGGTQISKAAAPLRFLVCPLIRDPSPPRGRPAQTLHSTHGFGNFQASEGMTRVCHVSCRPIAPLHETRQTRRSAIV